MILFIYLFCVCRVGVDSEEEDKPKFLPVGTVGSLLGGCLFLCWLKINQITVNV